MLTLPRLTGVPTLEATAGRLTTELHAKQRVYFLISKWGAAMVFGAIPVVTSGAAVMLIALYVGPAAFAQAPKSRNALDNIRLCNGVDRATPESRIRGCTALILSDDLTKNGLAIAFNNRGNAYAKKGAYDLAISDFDRSINNNPTDPKPLNNRGITNLKKGEYDQALEDLNRAIKLDPNYALAYANRAEVYQKKNVFDYAVRDYSEALRLNPDLHALLGERCWARAILGELQDALSDCNKALQFMPNNSAAYDSRGLIYLKMGQFDLAFENYNSALRFEPNLATALYGRGLAKRMKGDLSGAATDIAAAKAIHATVDDEFARYGVR